MRRYFVTFDINGDLELRDIHSHIKRTIPRSILPTDMYLLEGRELYDTVEGNFLDDIRRCNLDENLSGEELINSMRELTWSNDNNNLEEALGLAMDTVDILYSNDGDNLPKALVDLFKGYHTLKYDGV